MTTLDLGSPVGEPVGELVGERVDWEAQTLGEQYEKLRADVDEIVDRLPLSRLWRFVFGIGKSS